MRSTNGALGARATRSSPVQPQTNTSPSPALRQEARPCSQARGKRHDQNSGSVSLVSLSSGWGGLSECGRAHVWEGSRPLTPAHTGAARTRPRAVLDSKSQDVRNIITTIAFMNKIKVRKLSAAIRGTALLPPTAGETQRGAP